MSFDSFPCFKWSLFGGGAIGGGGIGRRGIGFIVKFGAMGSDLTVITCCNEGRPKKVGRLSWGVSPRVLVLLLVLWGEQMDRFVMHSGVRRVADGAGEMHGYAGVGDGFGGNGL